jgi:hypothetical protein
VLEVAIYRFRVSKLSQRETCLPSLDKREDLATLANYHNEPDQSVHA